MPSGSAQRQAMPGTACLLLFIRHPPKEDELRVLVCRQREDRAQEVCGSHGFGSNLGNKETHKRISHLNVFHRPLKTFVPGADSTRPRNKRDKMAILLCNSVEHGRLSGD